MAQNPRNIPANFPQPLGTHIVKAEAQRQASAIRQEVVTDLLSVLSDTREPNVRNRLIRVIEANLRAGMTSATRAENLWPTPEEVKDAIEKRTDVKPAVLRKHVKLFERFDRVHGRSLGLLQDSFQHIRVILDRVQQPVPLPQKPMAPPK